MIKTNKSNRSDKKGHAKLFVSLALVVILAISTVAVFAVANAPKQVNILDGEKNIIVTTNSDNPEEIIAEQGIILRANDELDASQFNMDNSVLIIKREMEIKLNDGKITAEKTVVARTVRDVFEYLCIEIGKNDVVKPGLNNVIKAGDVITFIKAGMVTIKADGEEITAVAAGKTVGEILEENSIYLSKEDETEPKQDTVVFDGDTITVHRVVYRNISETEKIPYETVTKETDSLNSGVEKVQTEGSEGEKTVNYKVKYSDGKEVSREAVNEKIIKSAVDRVVLIGTYEEKSVATGGKSSTGSGVTESGLSYSAKYTGIASAYYEPAGSLTASGLTVGVGRVGVNPNLIPYGTKLYITGYGYAVAADTGWGVKGGGRLVDLYMTSESACEQWGLRNVTIYVLN